MKNKILFAVPILLVTTAITNVRAEYSCRDRCIEMRDIDGVDICSEWMQVCDYTDTNGKKYFVEDRGNGGLGCYDNDCVWVGGFGCSDNGCVWVDHDGNLKAKAVIERNDDDNATLAITTYTDSGDKGSEIFLEYDSYTEMENFGWMDSSGNIRYREDDLHLRDTTIYASDGVTKTQEISEKYQEDPRNGTRLITTDISYASDGVTKTEETSETYVNYGTKNQSLSNTTEITYASDGVTKTSEIVQTYSSGYITEYIETLLDIHSDGSYSIQSTESKNGNTSFVVEEHDADGKTLSKQEYEECAHRSGCTFLTFSSGRDNIVLLKNEYEYDDNGHLIATWKNNSDGTTKKYDADGHFLGNYTSIGGELIETPKPAAQSSDSYTNNTSAEASMLVTGHGDNTISIYFK